MSNSIEDFIILLDANGFVFKRANGKHEIWSDGIENFTLPRGTVKSGRMHDFLRSELRKKVKNRGREFIDWSDLNKKGNKMFNSPRIEIEENIVDKGEWKTLDDDALHFCTEATKEKRTQGWMAESLMSLGYRGKKGGKITQTDISNFMISHGHKRFDRKVPALEIVAQETKPTIKIDLDPDQFDPKAIEVKKDPVMDQPKPVPETFKSELLDDVREIIAAPISDRLKDKLLRNLLK